MIWGYHYFRKHETFWVKLHDETCDSWMMTWGRTVRFWEKHKIIYWYSRPKRAKSSFVLILRGRDPADQRLSATCWETWCDVSFLGCLPGRAIFCLVFTYQPGRILPDKDLEHFNVFNGKTTIRFFRVYWADSTPPSHRTDFGKFSIIGEWV